MHKLGTLRVATHADDIICCIIINHRKESNKKKPYYNLMYKKPENLM